MIFCLTLYLSLAILIIREEITSSCGTIDNYSLAGAYLHHAALVTPAFHFTVFPTRAVPVKNTLFTDEKSPESDKQVSENLTVRSDGQKRVSNRKTSTLNIDIVRP